jgi:superfamily I DNA/RNA helicase
MKYKKYNKPEIEYKPFTPPPYPPSTNQQAIFDFVPSNKDSLQIEAVAGSGKSTTIKWLMTQYEEVSLALAFNNSIANDLKASVPSWVTASTCHSSGYAQMKNKFMRVNLVQDKAFFIMRDLYPALYDADKSDSKKNEVYSRVKNTRRLISLIKMTLSNPASEQDLMNLVDTYTLDMDDLMMDVFASVPHIMKSMLDQVNSVDFDDMMWMPIMLNLEMDKYPVVYVDECQDLNNLMTEYVKRLAGGKVISVGDRRQAIYGFSGANTNSIDIIKSTFNSHELPLDICYRCGSDIVEYAQRIVPHIKPWEGAGKGIVTQGEDIFSHPDGSMILCRRNAPLIKPCLQLIKQGRKAIVKGRNIGEQLVEMVKKCKSESSASVVDEVRESVEKKIGNILSRKTVNVAAVEQLQDSLDVIEVIAEDCSTRNEIENKINIIFSESTKGITLSSIHKAKGLEADEVSIIDYDNVRMKRDNMTQEMSDQESNLEYVAITRAKKKLNLIR